MYRDPAALVRTRLRWLDYQDYYGLDKGYVGRGESRSPGRGRVDDERVFYASVIEASHSLSIAYFGVFDLAISIVLPSMI